MTWLKKDDRFPEHRKIRRLGDGAYRLHDTALHLCAKDETDGRVTADDVAEMVHGPRLSKYIPTLVECGLWEIDGDGWLIHDFLDYNPSHQQQNEKRARDRERQARRRNRGEMPSGEDVSRRDSAATPHGVASVSQHPVPSRPDPTRKKTSSSEIASDPDAAPSDEVVELCEYLAERVRVNGHKGNVGKLWYRACRLLITVDHHDPGQIRKAIDWATTDSFWSANIQSMPKLREKYSTLQAQASRPAKPTQQSTSRVASDGRSYEVTW